MIQNIFSGGYADWGDFILRFAVGLVFIWHGWPKFRKPSGMAQILGAPLFVGMLMGMIEIVSGLALILNQYVQVAALLLTLIMVGAIYFKIFKWKLPFWAHDTTGWEFDFVLLAANLYLLLS